MKRELVTTTMEIVRNQLDQEVNIDGYVWYYTESNWGADADGHRGIKRTFVDDVTDVTANDDDGETIVLTKEETDKAMEILGNKFFEGS